MEQHLVSVIIPVYNGERYLAEAIESVLTQTYRPIEIIVVDDGSVDGTADIARSYKEVRYIYQMNQGHGMAKHVGVVAANGEFLAFLDADDVWTPNKLSVQIRYLQQNSDTGYVICNMRNRLEPGYSLPPWLKESDLGKDFPAYIPSAIVMRRTILEKVGNFDPDYRRGNDIEWHFRARDAGIVMANVNQVLLYRRIHGSNLTHDRRAGTLASVEMFRAIKASIDRKRKKRPNRKLLD